MRAEGTKTNTHFKEAPGFQARLGKGNLKPVWGSVSIRVTSDGFGETVSLEGNGFLIGCKVSDIEEVIRDARRERP